MPYAIDFMNPRRCGVSVRVSSITTGSLARLLTSCLSGSVKEERGLVIVGMLLSPEPVQTYAVAAAAEQQSRTITPTKKAPTKRKKS